MLRRELYHWVWEKLLEICEAGRDRLAQVHDSRPSSGHSLAATVCRIAGHAFWRQNKMSK